MIKVRCRTNLDEYKGKNWPRKMACRPLKGDAVHADCGARLYVVGVTHAQAPDDLLDREIAGEPFLMVELHGYYPALDGCQGK